MAAPTQLSESVVEAAVATASYHTITMPADIGAGDLIVMQFYVRGDPGTVTPPTGWTLLVSDHDGAGGYSGVGYYIYWRRATGSEGASVVVATSSSVYSGAVTQRIGDASDPIAVGSQASGSSTRAKDTATWSATGVLTTTFAVWMGEIFADGYAPDFTHYQMYHAGPGSRSPEPGWYYACCVEQDDTNSSHSEGYVDLDTSTDWLASNYYCTYSTGASAATTPVGLSVEVLAGRPTATTPPRATTPIGLSVEVLAGKPTVTTPPRATTPVGLAVEVLAGKPTGGIAPAVTTPSGLRVEVTAGTPSGDVNTAETTPLGITVDSTLTTSSAGIAPSNTTPLGVMVESDLGKPAIGFANADTSPLGLAVEPTVGTSGAASGSANASLEALSVETETGESEVYSAVSTSPNDLVIESGTATAKVNTFGNMMNCCCVEECECSLTGTLEYFGDASCGVEARIVSEFCGVEYDATSIKFRITSVGSPDKVLKDGDSTAIPFAFFAEPDTLYRLEVWYEPTLYSGVPCAGIPTPEDPHTVTLYNENICCEDSCPVDPEAENSIVIVGGFEDDLVYTSPGRVTSPFDCSQPVQKYTVDEWVDWSKLNHTHVTEEIKEDLGGGCILSGAKPSIVDLGTVTVKSQDFFLVPGFGTTTQASATYRVWSIFGGWSWVSGEPVLNTPGVLTKDWRLVLKQDSITYGITYTNSGTETSKSPPIHPLLTDIVTGWASVTGSACPLFSLEYCRPLRPCSTFDGNSVWAPMVMGAVTSFYPNFAPSPYERGPFSPVCHASWDDYDNPPNLGSSPSPDWGGWAIWNLS